MGLEVVFDNHPVRKQTFLDYKNIDFKQWPYWVFSKGLTHDFGQKLKISSLFVFAQNGLEIMFDDHLVRKEALPDYKNIDFIEFLYWIISKGFTYDFSKKLEFSSLFVFGQNGPWNNVWRSSTKKASHPRL